MERKYVSFTPKGIFYRWIDEQGNVVCEEEVSQKELAERVRQSESGKEGT